jgi:hypothetical protein
MMALETSMVAWNESINDGLEALVMKTAGETNLKTSSELQYHNPPPHVRAFRHFFVEQKAWRAQALLINRLRRCLFGGAAQLWYRVFVLNAQRCPKMLLVLGTDAKYEEPITTRHD